MLMKNNLSRQVVCNVVEKDGCVVVRRTLEDDQATIVYGVYRSIAGSIGKARERHSHLTWFVECGLVEDITTAPLPPHINALPRRSQAWTEAAREYRLSLKIKAEQIVRETFPGDFVNEDEIDGSVL